MKIKNISLFEAIATLVGTIIGAGILGVPYVFSHSGFWTGTFALILVGSAMLVMKLLFGEATLRTPGIHQLSGYAEIYLGKIFKYLMSFSLILGIYGSLLAYTIGQGEVISALTGLSSDLSSLLFYFVGSILVFFGLNLVKKVELWLTAAIIFVIIIIGVISAPSIKLANITGFDISSLFMPYGVILFACSGIVAVAEIRQELAHRKKLMKPAILIGASVPVLIYFLFAVFAVGVSGTEVTPIATLGLGYALGWKALLAINIFAFFAISTSFLTLSLALKQVYQFDYKIKPVLSWLLAMSIPIIIFLAGARDFIQVLGIVGALSVGFTGIMNVLIYFSARKKGTLEPEYKIPLWLGNISGGVIIIIFVFGLIYAVSEFV